MGDEHGDAAELRTDLARRHVERAADRGRLTGHLGPEQGSGGDALGEGEHIGADVADLVVAPVQEHLLREVDHGGGVAGYALGVHPGLHHLPLAPPALTGGVDDAVAREQAERVAPGVEFLMDVKRRRGS